MKTYKTFEKAIEMAYKQAFNYDSDMQSPILRNDDGTFSVADMSYADREKQPDEIGYINGWNFDRSIIEAWDDPNLSDEERIDNFYFRKEDDIILDFLDEFQLTTFDPKSLLNWGEVSRTLSGSRQTIRRNSIPKIHQQIISELLEAIKNSFYKYPNMILVDHKLEQ